MSNRITVSGRIGKDPEYRQFEKSGNAVTNFSIADERSYKDKNGDWQSQTDWRDVACWGKLAEHARKLKKGDYVLVEGSVSTRSWEDREGNKRHKDEINAFDIFVGQPIRFLKDADRSSVGRSDHRERGGSTNAAKGADFADDFEESDVPF